MWRLEYSVGFKQVSNNHRMKRICMCMHEGHSKSKGNFILDEE